MPTLNFTTPGWHTWDVPNDVEIVDVVLEGGGSPGSNGGRVTGKLRVKDTQRLRIMVGRAGAAAAGGTGGASTAEAEGGGGAGGNGSTAGGNGGGGASVIRLNTTDGTLKAVAGGAAGRSGDAGAGGAGGAATGGTGFPGTAGLGEHGDATGGTPIQGGNGGTSGAGATYNGQSASNTGLARAGRGGTGGTHGGGGGGGGYRSGGGGQAGVLGVVPGGGGGGGSNYTGGLTGASNSQGGGDTGNGLVSIEWVSPAPANQPPTTPTAVRIDSPQLNGFKNEADGLATKSTGRVTIQAVLDDPDGDKVRLWVQYSTNPEFAGSKRLHSEFIKPKNDQNNQNGRAEVTITGLAQDTRYYYRLWTEDSKSKESTNYNSGNFWTNRQPRPPELLTPAANATFTTLDSITFTWNHIDLDPSDSQTAFRLDYRLASQPNVITTKEFVTSTEQWVSDPGDFNSNQFYMWRVTTRDEQNRWGIPSDWRSFFVTGVTTPPRLVQPINGTGIDVGADYPFRWVFRDPNAGDDQTRADLRYRATSTDPDAVPGDWVILVGQEAPGVPGSAREWVIGGNTFQPGVRYEWQVRTYDLDDNVSQWSDSAFFFAVVTPGSAVEPVLPTNPDLIIGSLGCGSYRVYAYTQGGQQVLGEVTDLTTLTFGRLRDDISRCDITVTGFGHDCGSLLASLRCWMHELVVFRDGQRVWEGPITRLTYTTEGVGVEAKDVWAYIYRRILKQGYNDAHREINNVVVNENQTVVYRARQIVMNALAEHDPNLLQYLLTFDFPDDAKQGRIVPDFAKSAWEEIDDLAATAGLDYTAVGRRIMFWDTHRPIGRLPQMTDGDFSDPPIVSEYGMQTANLFGVTNNTGKYGTARPINEPSPGAFYGPVEMVTSSYGETADVSDMNRQATRNISNRWPTPVVVRVPDNSTLNPAVGVTFDQLIPGVWIPLRSANTLRTVSQWQKLDAVNVEYVAGVEYVRVIMSPAPNAGQDPDAEIPEEG